MANPQVYIGADVSKETIDIFNPVQNRSSTIRNTRIAARGFIRKVRAMDPNAMFCCESTGGYERTLMEACFEEGQPFCIMNAQQVRCYAGHLGLLEKTDKIDARVISLAATDKKPVPFVHPTPSHRKLRELWKLRRSLTTTRDAVRNQLEHVKEKESIATIKKLILSFEKEIKKIEEVCQEIISEDEKDVALLKRLQKVKGIGELTSIGIIALLPELYTLDDKKLTKLAGLAPICEDSGTLNAPRHIKKGRPLVRHILYWAALSASRHNQKLSEFYDRLVKAGKPKKVVLVAVMRKLLCLLRRIAQNPEFKPLET